MTPVYRDWALRKTVAQPAAFGRLRTQLVTNELELLAAFHALESFANRASKCSIRLMMDNVTAVNYVNKAGGTKSASLNDISQRIISWCEYRSISLHAFYPPGDLNREADLQSRVRLDASDWMVNPSVFSRISCHRMHSKDLFASAWNRQLETSVSWQPQPSALAIDAFSLDWHRLQAYAFPPFALIQRFLGKIRRGQPDLTLVAPYRRTQPWFPSLLDLAGKIPLVIRHQEILLDDSQCFLFFIFRRVGFNRGQSGGGKE